MHIEHAKRIKNSEDWVMICEEIQLRIDAQVNQLKGCGAEELAEIQARIRAFEEIKHLPQDVIEREEEE